MSIQVENIFRATAGAVGSEEFLTLLETETVKAQRIVSHAAKSPDEFWYEQSYTEWVMVVRGNAVFGVRERSMHRDEGRGLSDHTAARTAQD